jgi:putative ABC transport system permease protein
MVAVLCASMCVTTLLTVGRTASAEADMMARMEQAGSLELVVSDIKKNDLFSASVVSVVAALDVVERAVGFTTARDVRSGTLPDGGTQVPAWGVVGDISAVVTLTAGRFPLPGEALVSAAAMSSLGHDHPTGYAMQGAQEYPIVGAFSAREPFTNMATGIVIAAQPDATASTLHVIARNAASVAIVQQLTLAIVAAPKLEDITVKSAAALATLQGEIVNDLGLFGRQLLLLVLGAGAILTGVVVLADVLLRRSDLGRRRALGATRQTLITLVMLRTLIAALSGVALGVVASLTRLATWNVSVPLPFIAGTVILTLLAALIAAIGPAVIAATRDPVTVLRTP